MSEPSGPLTGKEIILGVTGGIAAYKSVELVRMLKGAGAGVSVVMTAAAVRFVSSVTFGAVTGRPVHTDIFETTPDGAISHIALTASADAFIVAPATANIIGKTANGIADDLISTMIMAARCPLVMAPAMNCRMYDSPAVQRNFGMLKDMGVLFVGPEEGPMACGEYGFGRMSEPAVISDRVISILSVNKDLAGRKVLVTAGPTLEDIDPVRFIGNRSTGKMGYAIAGEAALRGAEVVLVSGPTSLSQPRGIRTICVRSAAEMHNAALGESGTADIIIMAAAVSDYTPATVSERKIKKDDAELNLKLVKTPDILSGLGNRKKKGQVVVGFAAETDSIEENARKKLKEKRLDLIAANPVGGDTGFGSDFNILKVFSKDGIVADTGRVSKKSAAATLIDCITSLLR